MTVLMPTNGWRPLSPDVRRGRYSAGTTFKSYEEALAASAPNFINGFVNNTNIYNLPGNELFSPEGKDPGTGSSWIH